MDITAYLYCIKGEAICPDVTLKKTVAKFGFVGYVLVLHLGQSPSS